MKPLILIVLGVIGFALQGCSTVLNLPEVRDQPSSEEDLVRRIEIEIDDLERGLPCKVVHNRLRPRSGTSEIIWRAQFEKGFCHRKANESRLLLESQGWDCQIEHSNTIQLDPTQNVVMAWQCGRRLETAIAKFNPLPPVPTARPKPNSTRVDQVADQTLRKVVEQDLATIARSISDPGVTFEFAHGDLNSDNLDDAIVVLIRRLDERRWDRTIVAYLGDDPSYRLVDIRISPVNESQPIDDITVEIRDGIVWLRTCCDNATESTAFVLRDRELTYYN